MPFQTVCPGCQASYQILDQFRGRIVRCKKCQQTFAAEPAAQAKPAGPAGVYPAREARQPAPPTGVTARRVQREESPVPRRNPKKAPPGRRGRSPLPWIIGGAAAGLLVVTLAGGLGAWLLLGSRGKGQPTAVAVNTPAAPSLPAESAPAQPLPVQEVAIPVPAGQPNTAAAPAAAVVEQTAPPAPRGQLSAQALKDLKGATVFIKVEAGQLLSCSGSGFLVKVDGDTGYLITNHHVVNPEAEMLAPIRAPLPPIRAPLRGPIRGPLRGGSRTIGVRVVKYTAKNAVITAVFHSGSKGERPVRAEVLATDNSRDLAVLRVRGVGNWPRPITLEQKARLVETMPVYILGFPFGEVLAGKKGNPAITINKGSVSSLRENDYGQMKAVQIDGAINPGNSGGPVVDEDGRLVGISVATIRGSGIGLAIAPDELARMFDGRVGSLVLHRRKVEADSAEYDVAVYLIDPMNRIRSVALLYAVRSASEPQLQHKPDGGFDPFPGAQRLDLRIDGQKATGHLTLALGGSGPRFLAHQPTYVNGEGKTFYTQVRSQSIQPTPVTTPARPPEANAPAAPPAPSRPVPPPNVRPPQTTATNEALAGAKGNVAGQGAGSAAVRPNPDEKPAAVTTAPDGKGPPAVPLTQANLAPEKYQGQVVVIDHALLFGGVVGRGGNYELQVLFENERKPSNLAFPVTRLMSLKLEGQLRPQNYPVRLTCKIEKVQGAWQAQVSKIQLLDRGGQVVKTVE